MFLRVCLYDEVPTFGCGNRNVVVERSGKSKVSLICPTTLVVANISAQVWERIEKSAVPAQADRRLIKSGALRSIHAVSLKPCKDEKEEKALKTRIKGLKSRLSRVMAAL